MGPHPHLIDSPGRPLRGPARDISTTAVVIAVSYDYTEVVRCSHGQARSRAAAGRGRGGGGLGGGAGGVARAGGVAVCARRAAPPRLGVRAGAAEPRGAQEWLAA